MLVYELNYHQYRVLSDAPISIAIEQTFDEHQPNHFGADKAKASVLKSGSFVGDTRQGGSCNVTEITITPHCNGTHTESLSHITDQLIPVGNLAKELLPATLITVMAETGEVTVDNYKPALEPSDKVISKAILVQELSSIDNAMLKALVIRTLPNPSEKKHYVYGDSLHPPFFTMEAIEYLNQKGVEHLIVDVPSIDKMYDEGLLTNHHIFWNVKEATHELADNSWIRKTITELSFINNEVSDGHYLISLNIAPFHLDAAPSRPVLYPLELIK
ncbi:MAG: cyclase family protein [Gammaproteobacteria bacterium]|nr:cyclase family protein [Gammaproteobacteria bacterium]